MWRRASTAGRTERYQRGRTPHTALVWWARRPHAAMRVVVEEAIRGIDHPRVLDAFAGGATIPIEARRAGAHVTAVDNNELAVFINRLALELAPQRTPDSVHGLILREGRIALGVVARLTADVFPLRGQAIDGRVPTTYLWTYDLDCSCGRSFTLSKRPWLSRAKRIVLPDIAVGEAPTPNWTRHRARCPHCSAEHTVDVRSAQERNVVVVYAARGHGKRYFPAPVPPLDRIHDRELALLGALGARVPDTPLPRWSGIINPSLYGIQTHGDVLNARQRVVVLALIGALRERFDRLCASDGRDVASFVVGALSGLIDQVVDWSSRLSMWIPQNEQVGRAFSGPGVAMLFDYAEVDPVAPGPANLVDKLERIANGAAAMIVGGVPGRAVHASAQALPFEDDSFDAVVTDPPYYDNIAYTALADFFYTWKRPLLSVVAPDLFDDVRSRQDLELVASRHRHGDDAHRIYVDGLARALNEIARVLRSKGTLSIVYSHAALAGWAAFVEAFRASPLVVRRVQPLAVERSRPRSMNARAVDTCATFVATLGAEKKVVDRRTFERRVAHAIEVTDSAQPWTEADRGVALFAAGIAPVIGSSQVQGLDLAESLGVVEAAVQGRVQDFKLLRRRSM